MKRKAFTLIELLIVVAIIAILAAIAVPNFLEAQTRSKVSRVMADMRSYATGVESYRVDYNRMFPTYRPNQNYTRTWIWGYLTTPVAYMTSAPQDPFNKTEPIPEDRTFPVWGPDMIDGNVTIKHRDGSTWTLGDMEANAVVFFDPYPEYVTNPNSLGSGSSMTKQNFWVMMSWGPDQLFGVMHSDFDTPETYPNPLIPYDPTNGTISFGDVLRFQQ